MAEVGRQQQQQQQQILATSSQDFHEAMKASLLLKDDMPDLLSFSPLVVSLLGHLRLLGWSAAATVNIERQEGSRFKSNRMSPNLIQLQHQGRKMFDVAENKMMLIEQTIQGLFSSSGTVAVIVDDLRRASAGQNQAVKSIEDNMESLCTGITECARETKAVEKEITTLQDMAEELELACNNEFVISRRKYKEDEVEQDLLRRDESIINESMQRLDGVLQEAKKNYEAAQSDVKHARDNTGGLSTFGFVALASVANPIIKTVAHATDLVKGIPDLVGKFASPTFGIRTSTDKEYDPEATESVSKKSGRKTESPRKRAADNIAFEKAWELSQLVKNVQALLDSEGQESDISDYVGEIKSLRNEIRPHSKWSGKACTILSDCEKVLIKMLKLRKSSHDLNTTNAKLQHIKTWSKELAKAETLATELVTKADSEPGAVFGMIPPMFDAKTTPLIRPDNTMDSNAFLLKRQEELYRMELLCSAALDNYQKKVDQRSSIQGQVMQITRKLTSLHAEQATTDDIRTVLRNAGAILGRLQAQVQNLLRYFEKISLILRELQNYGCRRFTETVRQGLSRVDGGQQLAFSKFEAQVIYTTLLVLRGHAGALANSCSFYLSVSVKHLRPITHSVSNLSLTAPENEQQAAIQKLERDVEAATEAISDSGRQRILGMRKTLEKMGNVSHSNRQDLPELSVTKTSVIKTAVETISHEQGQIIEETEDLGGMEDFREL